MAIPDTARCSVLEEVRVEQGQQASAVASAGWLQEQLLPLDYGFRIGIHGSTLLQVMYRHLPLDAEAQDRRRARLLCPEALQG